MSKKFVNQIDRVVDDSLKGLVFSSTGIKFHPECERVVLRSDIEQYSQSKTALIAGGGSGHEPYAAGYVGKGLLTGAVAGNMFASPPSRHVQAALEATKSPGGAILFVINYTGDRLNFGLAAERFSGDVRVVTIADDIAIDNPSNRVGRRGLAGAVLAIKIAGAMAEQGKSLDDIYNTAQDVVKNIGTLGVSLYPGSLPGKDRETTLKNDEIEVGLGIHGEPGKTKTKYTSCREIIGSVLDTLKSKLNMKTGEQFVVLINNLGSVSQVEMNIVNGEVVSWFKAENMVIARLFSGAYMTSLDGHGISITIMSRRYIEFLDFPSSAPGWQSALDVNQFQSSEPVHSNSKNSESLADTKQTGATVDQKLLTRCLEAIVKAGIESEDQLNKLDAAAGDGDCGSTFASAAQSIQKSMKDLSKTHVQTLLNQLSTIFEQTVGGTSGALYALMLSSAASNFENNVDEHVVEAAIARANEAVQIYGGAKPGDRTMIDALDAIVQSLKQEKGADRWQKAVDASKSAAEATSKQKAAVGRASYTSDDSQTLPDAGATAISIWFKTLWEAVNN